MNASPFPLPPAPAVAAGRRGDRAVPAAATGAGRAAEPARHARRWLDPRRWRRRWIRWRCWGPTAKPWRRQSCTPIPALPGARARRWNRNSPRSPRWWKASAPPSRCGRCMPSTAHAGSEGLRRLLLAIVRDLRVVPILLARQLARMRHAERLPEPNSARTGRTDPRHPRAARQPAGHLAAEVGAGGPGVPLPGAGRPTSRSRACSTRSAATASATSSRSSARCARRWPRRA